MQSSLLGTDGSTRSTAHEATHLLFSQILAFEFTMLTPFAPRNKLLDDLQQRKLNVISWHHILQSYDEQLRDQWDAQVQVPTNCQSQGAFWSHVDIGQVELDHSDFAETGRITFSLDPPTPAGFSTLVYGGKPRVFLDGLQRPFMEGVLWKEGISRMVDRGGSPWVFTHKSGSHLPISVSHWNPGCSSHNKNTEGAPKAEDNVCSPHSNPYLHDSPYGLWTMQLDKVGTEHPHLPDLCTVKRIRLFFQLSGRPIEHPLDPAAPKQIFANITHVGDGDCMFTCGDVCDDTLVDCRQAADQTPCDDGDRRTTNDVCLAGACVGNLCAGVACTGSKHCHVAGTAGVEPVEAHWLLFVVLVSVLATVAVGLLAAHLRRRCAKKEQESDLALELNPASFTRGEQEPGDGLIDFDGPEASGRRAGLVGAKTA